MTESIESMARPPLEVVGLPTAKLEPDPDNPNRVSDAKMAALREDIEKRGFHQPVVVRPLGRGRWRIIDGEHRWRILTDLGWEETPCVVDDADEDEATMRLLTLNGLRGNPDPVKLARLLARLIDRYGEAELRKRLGMDEEEFTATLSLKDAGKDLDKRLADEARREELDAPEVMRWRMGPRQARSVEKALDAITAEGPGRAEALVTMLEAES